VADLDLARTERDRFHAVIDSLQEGVVAIDREERILFANEAVRQLIDAGDALLPGRPFWESVRQRDVLQLPVQAMEEEQAVFREVTLHLASGERTIQTSSFPLWMGSEEPNGAVLLLRDTTELRSLETIRRDFVANVSHELKTPLTAIAGLTETIIGDDEMPKSIQNNFIKRIHNQAERLSALVLDLLSLSRIEAYTSDPEAEQFDLMEIVQDCAARLSDLAHKQGHDLLLKRPDQPVPIHGDRESLTQAVDNLISNALRYTPNPGRVEVQVDRDASHGWISVSDNGIGIDRREQERIFERFYRVDKARSRELGGTGLGLSIVKHVVQRHGGTVDLISAPAEGSTFTIRLPVSEGASWLGPSA
jgi:two-component system phosphate regulon sensor histidine kinase PhoR